MNVVRAVQSVIVSIGILAIAATGAALAQETPAPAVNKGKPELDQEARLRLANEKILKDSPEAKITVISSTNPHLGGERLISHPFRSATFACVSLGCARFGGVAEAGGAPRRQYACINKNGRLQYPFDARQQFAGLLADEDTKAWKDEDFIAAGQLYAHLSAVANQDGWKLCKSADDFLAIAFNMPQQGPAAEKRQQAAKQIEAPKVVKAGDKTTVTFYAWHLIGGGLKRWTVEFGPEFKGESQELGRFGGGGYD